MTELVALDVGGTHARFAIASIAADGTIALGEPVTLRTSDYASLQTAWQEFERRTGAPVPRAASIAIAAPIVGDTIRMTNNSWIFHVNSIDDQLGLDRVTLINDFGAVAHAVARAPEDQLVHIAGPEWTRSVETRRCCRLSFAIIQSSTASSGAKSICPPSVDWTW